MQYFSLGTQIFVSRKADFNSSGIQVVNGLDKNLRLNGYILGWTNLSMLLPCDKVLMFDRSQKKFLWHERVVAETTEIETSFIKLHSSIHSGGTSYSDSLVFDNAFPESTMCLYSYADSDDICCCSAKDLFALAKKEYFYKSGDRPRVLNMFVLDRDLETCDSTVGFRKVVLRYEKCKQSGVALSTVLSVDINDNFVLIMK